MRPRIYHGDTEKTEEDTEKGKRKDGFFVSAFPGCGAGDQNVCPMEKKYWKWLTPVCEQLPGVAQGLTPAWTSCCSVPLKPKNCGGLRA